MAPYFLDTSGLVKRYVAEPGSAWLTGMTEVTSGNQCWISVVTQVEVLAAFYYRVRVGSLTAALAQKAEALFRHELLTHFRLLPVIDAVLNRAMKLVSAYPLRGYDAIQLATAVQLRSDRAPFKLPDPIWVSADQRLNQSAQAEGLLVDDPNLHP